VAAAEMAFAGGVGLTLRLSDLPRDASCGDVVAVGNAVALFSESSGRFLVEVAERDAVAFEASLVGESFACIGQTGGNVMRVIGMDGRTVLEASLQELKAAWQGGHVVHR